MTLLLHRCLVLLAATLLLGSCGKGDIGPLGPAGPPGDSVRGVTYVAHFDRASDLDSWEFTLLGDWRVEGSQLVVSAMAGERSIIGPASTFSRDLDVSVLARRAEVVASTITR